MWGVGLYHKTIKERKGNRIDYMKVIFLHEHMIKDQKIETEQSTIYITDK